MSSAKLQQKPLRPLGDLGNEPEAIAPQRDLVGTRSGTLREGTVAALWGPAARRADVGAPDTRPSRAAVCASHASARRGCESTSGWVSSCSQVCEQASSIVCDAACARRVTRDSTSRACARWIAAIRSRRASVHFIGSWRWGCMSSPVRVLREAVAARNDERPVRGSRTGPSWVHRGRTWLPLAALRREDLGATGSRSGPF